MSKKDYVAIAAYLKGCRRLISTGPMGDHVVDLIAKQLCDVFAEDNELFDRERFLAAAGVRS